MFYWDAIQDPEQRRACHAFGVTMFHRALPLMIAGGHFVVVDHVFERQSWYDECLAAAPQADNALVRISLTYGSQSRAKNFRSIGSHR